MILADKSQSLFISGISHELQMPLQEILDAATELLGDSPLNHSQLSSRRLGHNSKAGGVENVIVLTKVDVMQLIEEAVDGCWVGHRVRIPITGDTAFGAFIRRRKSPRTCSTWRLSWTLGSAKRHGRSNTKSRIVKSESVNAKLNVWSEEGFGIDIKVSFTAQIAGDDRTAPEMEPFKFDNPIHTSLVGFQDEHKGVQLLHAVLQTYLVSCEIVILDEDIELVKKATGSGTRAGRLGPSRLYALLELCLHAIKIECSSGSSPHPEHELEKPVAAMVHVPRRHSEETNNLWALSNRPKSSPRSSDASTAHLLTTLSLASTAEKEEQIVEEDSGTLLPSSMGTINSEERHFRVLVVEDNRIWCCFLVKWLTKKMSLVYALNRPRSRMQERQRTCFLTNGIDIKLSTSRKLKLLEGNLTKAAFGLAEEDFTEIRRLVTYIIQNAWRVDFNMSLSSLEPYVEGTRNLVDFAWTRSPQSTSSRFIFVSTAEAFRKIFHEPIAPEARIPDSATSAGIGFAESKWVAKQVVEIAVQKVNSMSRLYGDNYLGVSGVPGCWVICLKVLG
ncbi:male sterility protein-domain-containing protein [Mycena galopus ATCC 62051]|nr:male sterility protein-domain-containing protein [Mycena galopus ATCC 62051]